MSQQRSEQCEEELYPRRSLDWDQRCQCSQALVEVLQEVGMKVHRVTGRYIG